MSVLGLLLAAGRGVRLAPLTDTRPKATLPLLDVPLGAWALADLATVARELVVNASAHAEVLEAALRPYAPGAEFMVELPEPWGSGGTVAALKERVTGVIVTRNADHLTDLRCADLLATHTRNGTPATVAIAPVLENGDFKIEGDHAVTLIERGAADSSGDYVWIGSAVFDRAVLDLIPAERPIDLARGLLGQLVRSGELGVHIHRGYQLDVGSPSNYLRASIDLLYGRGPGAPSEGDGEVLLTGGGRAYVGRNAHVREEWLGPDAIVLAGAQVPGGSFVSRTIVMPGERVASDTTLSGDIWVDGHAVSAHP
jgi:NDP-sugar pyrophosphorylase family protein